MSSTDFRAELMKVMPGLDWNVHDQISDTCLLATGIKSRGYDRMFQMSVQKTGSGNKVEYEVWSSGYATHTNCLHPNRDTTLESAVRGLQNHYKIKENEYRSHADAIHRARIFEGSESSPAPYALTWSDVNNPSVSAIFLW